MTKQTERRRHGDESQPQIEKEVGGRCGIFITRGCGGRATELPNDDFWTGWRYIKCTHHP